MDEYLQKTKDVILGYLAEAKKTEAKISQGRTIYQADAMEREEQRLRGALAKTRAEAEAKIDAILSPAMNAAREWGKLDGAKLTADAELLNQGISPEQFSELVERYQDNYTMLDTLRMYGNHMNKVEIMEARKAGNNAPLTGSYDVHGIPDAGAKLREVNDMRARADYFLNVADGNGMDTFSLNMARGVADREFEAWGADAPNAQKDPDAAQKFIEAWGYSK